MSDSKTDKLEQDKTRQDFIESVRILQKLPQGNGKVGVEVFVMVAEWRIF